jgi:glutamate synthase domain-containing protein 1
MLELLLAGGMDVLQAMRILIPPATSSLEYKDPDLAAFYEYYGLSLDPGTAPPASCFATAATPPARSTATACARPAGC